VNDQILQTETALENVNQRIELVTEQRTDRWEQCEEAAKDYMDARAARDADRQVVSDTIGLVNKELRTLKEALAQRQAAGIEI
jgi:predicted  nucleic acid-binding Zn-ribbon protein